MKPNTINYSSLIPYKIIQTVSLIIEINKIDFIDAVSYLYKSKLYENLSIETTKLWHLSAEKLFDLLENEKQNNVFEFPDFV
jgi:hypothetical protein